MNSNRYTFLAEYRKQLEIAVTTHPEEYGWPLSELETVAARMSAAIERGSYNKDSRAIRATCKTLGIRHSYIAIGAFLVEGQ